MNNSLRSVSLEKGDNELWHIRITTECESNIIQSYSSFDIAAEALSRFLNVLGSEISPDVEGKTKVISAPTEEEISEEILLFNRSATKLVQ